MNLMRQAKEYLILYYPFFAYLALQIEFVEDSKVKKSSIDGKLFRYNPEHIVDFDVRQCAAFIARAMAHVLLLHPLRAKNKNAKRWDKACAYAVNKVMKDSNIQLLNDLYDANYDNCAAEDIYEMLEESEEQEKQQQDANNNGIGFGESSDNSNNNLSSGQSDSDSGSDGQHEMGDSDICEIDSPIDDGTSYQDQEQQMIQKIMDAAMQSEFAGTQLTESITAIIKQLKEAKHDWREILMRFFAEISSNDYDWEKPDLAYLQRNIYIPGLHSLDIGGIVFAIDTSISVNDELLATFLTELREAAEQVTKEITVIHCDTEVRCVEEVESEDIEHITPKGRGGTKFSPVFKYIDENELSPKALIYFTDGKCHEVLTEPSYPVIWCIYENKNFKPQFGESIIVDN